MTVFGWRCLECGISLLLPIRLQESGFQDNLSETCPSQGSPILLVFWGVVTIANFRVLKVSVWLIALPVKITFPIWKTLLGNHLYVGKMNCITWSLGVKSCATYFAPIFSLSARRSLYSQYLWGGNYYDPKFHMRKPQLWGWVASPPSHGVVWLKSYNSFYRTPVSVFF